MQKEKAARSKPPAVAEVKYHAGLSEHFPYQVANFSTSLINI